METYKLFGFMAPGTGEYVRTMFRERWEHGGVFILDDFDGSDPVAAIELNNPLANHSCSFPDAVVPRHKDFVLILTANTWGHGGTDEYVGRLKQDKAFLDRFVKLDWDIDEDLELATCPDTTWCKEVQRLRKNAKKKGLRVLITPRASYYGAALLGAGIEREDLVNYTVKPGLTADQWSAIAC